MKQICACFFGLCGVLVVSLAGAASAERLFVSERHGVHQNGFEHKRFLYKVGESSLPDYGDMHDPDLTPPFQRGPFQGRQDQPSGNDTNDEMNLSDSGVNRSITPSADVPNSVHGGGSNPLPTFPDARPGPEGDPAVRDLGGSGLSAPSAPPGSLGR